MKNLKVAITGGIGSGKSEVLKIISSLGYKTVSLDEVYAQLLLEKSFVLKISKAFNVEPIISNGRYILDRNAISNIVFGDKNQLKKLNELTHSAIFERAFSQQTQITFYEVPLLFEGGYESLFDKVLVVVRDKKERINSAVKRDGSTEEQILKKIENQIDYEKLDLTLHTIIKNDANLSALKDRVIKAIEDIKKG